MSRQSYIKQPAALLLLCNIILISIHTNGALSLSNTTDHLALLAVKAEIKQDPRGILDSWNASLHFCHWPGVTCGRRHQRVTRLDLKSNGLVGSLSPFIGNLSFLREIWIQNNTFYGEIPSEVGRLSRLQLLHLEENTFKGQIPPNLSHCSDLDTLRLGYNGISGKLPNELGSLSMLNFLTIHSTNITGGIPSFIGNLTSLETISFADCPLGGGIPDVFNRLEKLQRLGLGRNGLVGTIPSTIYNLSKLMVLSVDGNQLYGHIPTNLGSMLPHLQLLQLHTNQFTGTLPPSISNCSELSTISAGLNNFNGKIAINFSKLKNLRWLLLARSKFGSGEPDEMKFIDSLSNCSNLVMLELSNNQLTGTLPNSLGNLSSKLEVLGLYGNNLYGSIPSSISNLLNLTKLGMGENKITGHIPQSFGKLCNLKQLYLNVNFLSGSIPESLGNLSFLLLLVLEQNNLGGNLPSTIENWHTINSLYLSHNSFVGTIPKQLLSLSSLSIVLDLSHNHFSGHIPLEVRNLRNLGALFLADNDLSGELPHTLGGCTSLEFLELGGNILQGTIPPSLSSLKALRALNLSNNNFSGQIPRLLEKFALISLDLSNNIFEGEIPMMGIFRNASAISVIGNKKLCGGILELHLPKCKVKHREFSIAVIIVIPIVSTLLCASMVSYFVICRCTRARKNKTSSSLTTMESFLKVSYEGLLKATDGFSETNLIGRGGFSSVYKGILEEGGMIVAVKVLNLTTRGSSKSFSKECNALRNVRHRNLVKVVTSCSSIDFQGNDFKAIIYEFMSNGSLESWLHSGVRTTLGLLQRIRIAIDVACAMDYVHEQCGQTIVHCDLKPSNILLDDDMVAYVGDFGLAKIIHKEFSREYNSSSIGIRGTIGYAAPEYGLGSEVSASGDIYSYGIVLLEMMTGKRPTDELFKGGLDLHRYALTALDDHSVLQIVDPILLSNDATDVNLEVDDGNLRRYQVGNNETTKKDCLISLIKIGVACSVESPKDRMEMSGVVRELQSIRASLLGT